MAIRVHLYLPDLDVSKTGTAGSVVYFEAPVNAMSYITNQVFNLKRGEKLKIEIEDERDHEDGLVSEDMWGAGPGARRNG